MKLHLLRWSLVVVFAWALAACGASPSAKAATTLNITVSDTAFSSAAFTIPAGKMITVNLKNTGAAPHSWTIMLTPVSGTFAAADSAQVFFSSDVIEAGTSFTLIFKAALKPGSYQVVSTQSGDFEKGLVGSLTVQ